MRKFVSLLSVLMLFCAIAYAQTREIRGQVTDENGNPIPFASVVVRGSNQGTSADQNGNFTIRAKTGDVLVFSSQGRTTTEVTVGAGQVVNASLGTSTSTTLSEVVVTGAFNIKRTARSTSYNAQVVNAEQLNVIRSPNLNNALAGKVSGIQVRSQSAAALGRAGNIRLRGENGLGGGENILYVADGSVISNPEDINLDDVENVTVLQGPAAAALFGPQGANGAIVLTLKKARRNAPGIGVDVNLGATFDKVYILPNYQNSYAGGADADLRRYTWKADDPIEWKALDGKYYHDYSDDASWGPRMVGQEYIPWYAWYGGHSRSYQTALLTPQPDNARDFFNTGVTLNNSVAFSKATDGANFRISYGNINTNGLLPTTSLKRNTLNLSGSADLNSHFTVGTNINYVASRLNGEIDDGYSNQSTGSFNQWFHRDLDMNIMRELKDLRTPTGIYASWNKANPVGYNPADPRKFYAGNYWYNFFTWFDLVHQYTNSDKLFGDVSLTYNIIKGLSLKGTFRKNLTNGWGEQMYQSELLESGLQTQGNEPRARGYYSTYTSNQNQQNLEFLATLSRQLGSDVQLNFNAGTNFFSSVYKDNSGNTNQGLNVPNLFTLSNSKNPASQANNRINSKNRAVFGRGDIGFKNTIFGEFSLRNDWFSALPPENNDVLSKSFGASFVFSELTRDATPWLSWGKLRASWGEIPQSIGTYAYPGFLYGVGQFQWNGNFLMGTPDQLVDSSIHGAVKTQKEIGLELRFFRNRLGLTSTYWDGTEKDFPQAVSINGASGFTSLLTNAGEITKKGLEFQFMARPLWMNKFQWELNATWAKLLEHQVVSVAPGVDRITVQSIWANASGTGRNGTPYLVHQEGKPWGQIYGNGYKRIDGKPVLNSNGSYVSDPNTYFGSAEPEFTGGLQNSFRILENITLNVNIDYQKGGKFFSLSDMWGSYSGLTARTATINDKGNPIRDAVADGGGVHVFGVDATGKPVDYYVEGQSYFHNLYDLGAFDEFVYDLTFVKLRELSIGYNIPVNKIGVSKWVNRANFSIVARNPLLIYAKTADIDPSEVSLISGEAGQLPGTRGLGFNLKVGF